ncbi:Protein unc-80 [Branchiostoma belcheri]|nr:Protein unc-80 [Branchiostoma belcheri]
MNLFNKTLHVFQLSKVAVLTEQESLLQDRLQEKLYGSCHLSPAHARGNWDVLHDLFQEMKQLRDIAISGKERETRPETCIGLSGPTPRRLPPKPMQVSGLVSRSREIRPLREQDGLIAIENLECCWRTVMPTVGVPAQSAHRCISIHDPSSATLSAASLLHAQEERTSVTGHGTGHQEDDSVWSGRARSMAGHSPQASWEKAESRGASTTNKKMSLLHPTHFETGDYADQSPMSTKSYGGASFTGIAPIAETESAFGLYSSDEGEGNSMRGSPTVAGLMED